MSTPDFPSRPVSSTGSEDQLRRDAADLAKTATHDLADVADKVKQEAAAVGEEAKAQFAEVADKAKGFAESQKEAVVGQLDSVSSSLDKVAGELEGKGEGTAQYVRMVADGAEKLTSTVRDNSVDEIVAIAEDFGRKQPAAFMGAAALLGFVASRFLVASASRRAAGSGSQPTDMQGSLTSSRDHTASRDYTAGSQHPQKSATSYSQSVGGDDAGI